MKSKPNQAIQLRPKSSPFKSGTLHDLFEISGIPENPLDFFCEAMISIVLRKQGKKSVFSGRSGNVFQASKTAPFREDLTKTMHSVWGGNPARLATLMALVVAFLTLGGLFFTRLGASPSNGYLIALERVVMAGGPVAVDPTSSRSDARFELVNRGQRPVRILSIESGCGCAKPSLSSELVKPGGSSIVNVSVLTPPVGERLVTIKVNTDSPLSLQIPLVVKVMGRRRPPFLLQLEGDLTFRGDYSPGLRRELTVLTVDAVGAPVKWPSVSTDLKLLKLTEVDSRDEPYAQEGTILRRLTYAVELVERPPARSFAGTVVFEDPWNHGSSQSINVAGQFRSGLTATPPSLRIGREPPRTASLVVISSQPVADLTLEVEHPSVVALTARRESSEQIPTRFHKITINLHAPVPAGGGSGRIFIGCPGSTERISIPISVESE